MDRSGISFLKACPHCARTFNSDSLKRHVDICLKTSKKRKVFDLTTQRWKNDKEDYKFTRVEKPMARPNKKKEQVVVEEKKDKQESKVENNVVTPRPEVQNKKKQVANKKVKPANQDRNKQEIKTKIIVVQLQTPPAQKDIDAIFAFIGTIFAVINGIAAIDGSIFNDIRANIAVNRAIFAAQVGAAVGQSPLSSKLLQQSVTNVRPLQSQLQ